MAQCKQGAHEFIQSAFCPVVAVLASQDAENICKKNNLSFVEMIQPFCRLTSEAHIRDPSNTPHGLHNFKIIVKNIHQQPHQPTLAKKLLNESVSSCLPVSLASDNGPANIVSIGDYDLQLSVSTPWFEAYRECFFRVSYISDHEFLKNYTACMFIVSSSHPDPMAQFKVLSHHQQQQQHQQPGKHPRWFCPNVLKYYVLLHDVIDGEDQKADSVYQSMKTTYGSFICHLLSINSRQAPPMSHDIMQADPWSQFINKTTLPNAVTSEAQMNGLPEKQRLSSVENAVEALEEPILDHPLANHTAVNLENTDSGSMDSLNSGKDSRSSSVSTPHGLCLTTSDQDKLRILMHEFIVRGLLPWAERQIKTLNELVSSKKTRGLFSGAKRWFGGSKPAENVTGATVVYTQEAPEMQLRRLGDLSFMFQMYELAYQTFHTAKRDFNNDHAWLHCAGALEMAGVSIFMQGIQNTRQFEYMESAIGTYLNTCKNGQFATRASLLYTEILKSKQMFTDAAVALIKMTSEDADLRSALLLEQAAHCFLNVKQPRKYAFNMILTGHRFNKASQKQHALRSYQCALNVYKGKNWILAEDHINFTVGRQSMSLRQMENATFALRQILSHDSKQSHDQQVIFLKEYLFVLKQFLAHSPPSDNTLCQLPLPLVDGNQIKVMASYRQKQHVTNNIIAATGVSFDCNDEDNTKWYRLEELCLRVAGVSSSVFEPTIQCYTNQTDNSGNPNAVISEPMTVELSLENPLKVNLVLNDVSLLWQFSPEIDSEVNQEQQPPPVFTNEQAKSIKSTIADELVTAITIKELTLEAKEQKKVQLTLIPQKTGELHIIGVGYQLGMLTSTPQNNLTNSEMPNNRQNLMFVRGKQLLEVQGPRLNASKADKASKVYGPDRRLDLLVVPPMPQLQVSFEHFPKVLSCGQIQRVNLVLSNSGPVDLCNIMVSSPTSQYIMFTEQINGNDLDPISDINQCCGSSSVDPNKIFDPNNFYPSILPTADDSLTIKCTCNVSHLTQQQKQNPNHSCINKVPIRCQSIKPHQTVLVPMYVIGANQSGTQILDMLFYYEPMDETLKIRHRIVRHSAALTILSSLCVKAWPSRGTADESNSATISLEIENLSQVQVQYPNQCLFNILQVSGVSNQWCLHHLSTKPNTDVRVIKNESMQIVLKACKCEKEADKEKEYFSNVVFDQHAIDSAVSPCADFYSKSKDTEIFKLEDPPPDNLYQVEPPAPTVEPFEGLDKAVKLGMTLIVLWKGLITSTDGHSDVIVGQHHVNIDGLDTLVASNPLTKVVKEQPAITFIKQDEFIGDPMPDVTLLAQVLKVNMEYQQIVYHDFTGPKRLCQVPLKVSLQNTSNMDVMVIIEANTRKTNSTANEPTATKSKDLFTFSGQVGRRFNVPANNTIDLDLKASFWRPGVYHLNCMKIVAGSENTADFVPQKHVPSHSITILSTNG